MSPRHCEEQSWILQIRQRITLRAEWIKQLCDRPKLDMAPPAAGKSWRNPRADFILTRAQRKKVLEWFQTLMFSDGYATNLSREVNLSTMRINGLKSHDYHI